MQYFIPPSIETSKPTGVLKITLAQTYLQTPINDIGFNLQMWGYGSPIPVPNNLCLELFVVTSQANLVQYLRDMNMIVVEVLDKRIGKVIANAYVKINTYIVNEKLGNFQEQIPIVMGRKGKKIGSLIFGFSVSFGEVQGFQSKKLQPSPTGEKQNKRMKQLQQLNEELERKPHKQRTVFVEPNVLEEETEKLQFYVDKVNEVQQPPIEQEIVERKNKPKKNSGFMIPCTYESEKQPMKTETTNPCLERMKLREDEIKLFPKIIESRIPLVNNPHKLWVTQLTGNKYREPWNVLLLQDNKVIFTKKFDIDKPVLIEEVSDNYVLRIQTQDLCGQCPFKGLIRTGITRCFLKKKNSQRKDIEVQIKLQPLLLEKEQKKAPQQKPTSDKNLTEEVFRIEVIKQKQQRYEIEVEGHEKVDGNIMMFKSKINPVVRVYVSSIKGTFDVSFTIDSLYKEEVKEIKRGAGMIGKVKAKMGKGSNINDILPLFSLDQQTTNNPKKQPSPEKQAEQREERYSNISSQQQQPRRTKTPLLKWLILSFQRLIQCGNSQCMQLIQQLKTKYSPRQFQKLSQLSEMPELTYIAFKQLLHEDFPSYWQCFQQYRQWNHLYQRTLRIVINRLKHRHSSSIMDRLYRGGDILFGLVGQTSVQNQFLKYYDMQTSALVAELLVRYPEHFIKVEQLQQYICEGKLLFLNHLQILMIYAYEHGELLAEVCEQHAELTAFTENPFLPQLKKHAQQDSPQITSQHQHITTEDYHIQTEQKQPTQQKQTHKSQPAKMQLVICVRQVETFNKSKVSDLVLSHPEMEIRIEQLPQPITLLLHEEYEIRGRMDGEEVYGMFLTTQQTKKIPIYQNNTRIGIIHLQPPSQNADDEIIQLEINNKTTFQRQHLPQLQQPQPQIHDIELRQKQRISGEKVRINIVHIHPYRPNYQLRVGKHLLTYPHQESVVVDNEGVDVEVEGMGIARVDMWEGRQELCIVDDDGKMVCLVRLDVEQYAGQVQPPIGCKVILLNIYNLICRCPIPEGQYTLLLYTHDPTSPLHTVPLIIQHQSRKVPIEQSLYIPASTSYQLCLTQGSERLTTFNWKVKYHSQLGIYDHMGFLIGNVGYRLDCRVYEINYNDVFSEEIRGRKKFQQLLSIFQVSKGERIRQQLSHGMTLPQTLQNFTQTQMHVLLSLKTGPFEQLFFPYEWHFPPYYSSISKLYDEFELFDFHGSGIIGENKLAIVNKLVLKESSVDYAEVRRRRQDGWLLDANVEQVMEVDYLFLLWVLAAGRSDFFGIGEKVEEELCVDRVRVRVVSYAGLRVNERPATLLFEINGVALNQPVARAFNHQFPPSDAIILSTPLKLTIYNKVYSGAKLFQFQPVFEGIITAPMMKVLGGELTLEFSQPPKQKPVEKQEKNPGNRKNKWKQSTNSTFQRLTTLFQQPLK